MSTTDMAEQVAELLERAERYSAERAAALDRVNEALAAMTAGGALEPEPWEQAMESLAEAAFDDPYTARDYSMGKRKEFAEKGWALDDGSFPIADAADLERAVQAVGRAKDYNRAKRHIIRRAKQLGRTDLLPDDWDY